MNAIREQVTSRALGNTKSMNKKKNENIGWIIACIYATFIPIIFSILANWNHLPTIINVLWSEEASGWAQAIGSVIAIYFGFTQAKISIDASRKLSHDDFYRKNLEETKNNVAIFDYALSLVRAQFSAIIYLTNKESWKSQHVTRTKYDLNFTLLTIEGLKLSTFPNVEFVLCVTKTRITTGAMLSLIEEVGKSIPSQPTLIAFEGLSKQLDEVTLEWRKISEPYMRDIAEPSAQI